MTRYGLALVLWLSSSVAVAVAFAQSPAVLSGTAVTLTGSVVSGDVDVWPGTAITQTGGLVTGTLHPGDVIAEAAFMAFVQAYDQLRDHPPACRATLTATLNETLLPGVYCVDATAKAGVLMLDAQGHPNATWTFLVNGALTGTGWKVILLNEGLPCNVLWWVKAATTLTSAQLQGSVLSGAAATTTNSTVQGDIWATAGVTLTTSTVTSCAGVPVSVTPPMCVDGDRDRGHDRDKDSGHDQDKDKDHNQDRDRHDHRDDDHRNHQEEK